MINAKKVLAKLNINQQSYLGAIQEVRDMIDSAPNKIAKAISLVQEIAGVTPELTDYDQAICVAQTVAEFAVREEMFDPEAAIEKGNARYARLKKDQSWMFESEGSSRSKNEVAVVEGIDVKVEVKADGKIKKGGKQILAAELYKKHVLEAASPLDNKAFIEVLVKELGMSKAGATTYAWNCRKQLGEKSV
jgi:hypothetical protein